MEHLNYCRQMVKQFGRYTATNNGNREIFSHAIDLAGSSVKFLLPDTGRLYDDPEYRALDETQELNLPYEFIALEYSRLCTMPGNSGEEQSSKAIVFARQRDDFIAVTPIVWFDKQRLWAPMPEVALPRVGYLERDRKSGPRTGIKVFQTDHTIPASDYTDELIALLCFLNVLQCRNVHVERSEPKNAGKKIKAALPFDTYHILTIDVPGSASDRTGENGNHRSPREHLRRGHIRRLADGRRIWVNATVVAARRGAGTVTKDYAIRCGA